MDKFQIFFIISIIVLVFGLSVYYFIFNTYEVSISIKPKNLFADYKSTTIIKVIPINSLGFEIPFRSVKAKIEIEEGNDLIDIIKENEETGVFILRAKDKPGKVKVIIKSDKSLLPTLITIIINSTYAAINFR